MYKYLFIHFYSFFIYFYFCIKRVQISFSNEIPQKLIYKYKSIDSFFYPKAAIPNMGRTLEQFGS